MVNSIYNSGSINYNIAKDTKIPEQKDTKTPEQKELFKACTEFEALMVKQMLQAMQSSSDPFGKSFGGDYFKDMFQNHMAKQISDGGLGLAKVLYEQIVKTNNVK
jgi:Rod binding domain-containing protein